jgi:hypothetical protein
VKSAGRRALGCGRTILQRDLVGVLPSADSTDPAAAACVRTSFWFTMASATFGLVAGVLLAAPLADLLGLDDEPRPRRLRRRHRPE